MSRPRGGFIGFNPAPAASAINSAAGGIWTLREAEALKRAGTWPTVAPGGVATGLQLWLDASDASTLYDATTGGSLVAADGGVARWEDKSGNDYHMTQATAGSRPARKTAIQGGLDVLRFDGSDDALLNTTFNQNGQAGTTVFGVVKTVSQASQFVTTYKTSTPANGWLAVVGNSTATYGVSFEGRIDNSGGSYRSAARSLTGSDDFVVFSGKYDGSELIPYQNGNAGTADTAPSGNIVQTAARLAVGQNNAANDGGANAFSEMDLGEIIIYNSALSDTDREAVESYLLAKWSIT